MTSRSFQVLTRFAHAYESNTNIPIQYSPLAMLALNQLSLAYAGSSFAFGASPRVMMQAEAVADAPPPPPLPKIKVMRAHSPRAL